MPQAGVSVGVTGTPRGPPETTVAHSFGPCLPPRVCQRAHPEATGALGDLVGVSGRPHSPPVMPAGHTGRENSASATRDHRHHSFLFTPLAHRSPLQGHRNRRLFVVSGRPELHFPRRVTRTVRYRPGAATRDAHSSVPLRGLFIGAFCTRPPPRATLKGGHGRLNGGSWRPQIPPTGRPGGY